MFRAQGCEQIRPQRGGGKNAKQVRIWEGEISSSEGKRTTSPGDGTDLPKKGEIIQGVKATKKYVEEQDKRGGFLGAESVGN